MSAADDTAVTWKKDADHTIAWREGVSDAIECLREPGIMDKGDCVGRLERLLTPPGEPPAIRETSRSTREKIRNEQTAIESAHPLTTGRHDLYNEAMRLVGERHGKGDLVDLVNWLLYRIERIEAGRHV